MAFLLLNALKMLRLGFAKWILNRRKTIFISRYLEIWDEMSGTVNFTDVKRDRQSFPKDWLEEVV